MKWTPGTTLEQIERETIIDALRYCDGNRTMAAQCLGISRATIGYKLKAYREQGFDVPLAQGETPDQSKVN